MTGRAINRGHSGRLIEAPFAQQSRFVPKKITVDVRPDFSHVSGARPKANGIELTIDVLAARSGVRTEINGRIIDSYRAGERCRSVELSVLIKVLRRSVIHHCDVIPAPRRQVPGGD